MLLWKAKIWEMGLDHIPTQQLFHNNLFAKIIMIRKSKLIVYEGVTIFTLNHMIFFRLVVPLYGVPIIKGATSIVVITKALTLSLH